MNPLSFVDRLLGVVPPLVPTPAPQPDTAWQRCVCAHFRRSHHDGTEGCTLCYCSYFQGIDTP